MRTPRMHPDEALVDEALVRRLVARQFPEWRALPIARVAHSGTDNAIFRLGDEMAARLPRIHWATGQVDKEHEWLPRLAPNLPLRVPTPIHKGSPGFGYPWQWSVHRWLEGESALNARVHDPNQAALDLAAFVSALRRVDVAARPPSLSGRRGGPLEDRDDDTRAAIAALDGLIDVDGVTAAWQASLDAPRWEGAPVCLHADLSPGNLLIDGGRITAVIDFGELTTGDPACDLMVAWNYLSARTRAVFRAALSVDDATWARGRGWALSVALIALPYYLETSPQIAATSRRTIRETLLDHQAG